MKKRSLAALALSSGALLALSFPPIPVGFTAFVGFVPFLYLMNRMKSLAQGFRYSYLTFLFFNFGTIYWISGWWGSDPWLKAAGIAVNLVHPLLFTIPSLLYLYLRRRLGAQAGLFLFPFLWTTYEWLAQIPELSFPWLIIGNSQAYEVTKIQFISVTGIFGASFWILSINVLLFKISESLLSREHALHSRRMLYVILACLVLLIVPEVYSRLVLSSASYPSNTITVGVLQPNVDPYEKWSAHEVPLDKVKQILKLYDSLGSGLKCDLALCPETAIPFLIREPSYSNEYGYLKNHVDSISVPLLTGFADIKWYEKDAPATARTLPGSEFKYETFNSSMLVLPRQPGVQVYHKSKLTPLSERIPYLDLFPFLQKALTWSVGISSWGNGNDTTVFRYRWKDREMSTWAMICYETIYPEFVSGFVARGARFLCVITNDGWFGNSSGPYQLECYAALRAIECRRAVARCANNGISCFIDPYGRISKPTGFGTRTVVRGTIEVRDDTTFYVAHGDWFAKTCALVCGVGMAVALFRRKQKT